MAELQLFRRPHVLRTHLHTLQQSVLHEAFAGRPPVSSRSFSSRFYRNPLDTARQSLRSTQRLPRSFHPPRKPQAQQIRLKANKSAENARLNPDPTEQLGSPRGRPAQSLSERFRKLSREYGWAALGVYLALSALDFPFCFLAVRMLGTDRIAHWEQKIVRGFWTTISWPLPGGEEQARSFFRGVGEMLKIPLEAVGLRPDTEKVAQQVKEDLKISKEAGQHPDAAIMQKDWSWGVEEAEAAHRDNASLATQLALAYAIHKSFIFIRIPLTAAVLPRVVRTLRGWGWDIGKRTPKAP